MSDKYLFFICCLLLWPLLIQGQNQVVLKGHLVQTGGNLVLKDGSLTNDGTLSQSAGSLKMTGTASDAQSQIGGSSVSSFFTLEIAKTSNNVLLGQEVNVNNSLLLNGGLLDIGNFNLNLADGAGISNAAMARFVKTSGTGTLRQTVGNSNILFPVGLASYNPATVLNSGTADQYGIRIFDEVLDGGDSGSPLADDYVPVTWLIDETVSGGSDLTLTLQWNEAQEPGTFTRMDSYVAHYDGGTWDAIPSSASAGAGPYTQTRAGITTLSPFAVFEDNLPPTAICMDITVALDEDTRTASITADDVDNNSTDDSEVASTEVDITDFDCLDIGDNEVILTVTDIYGNTATCSANVLITGLPCEFEEDPDGINCTDGNDGDYDPVTETFSITSEGCYDPSYYSNTDAHGYVATNLCGNGEIIAEVVSVDGNGWAGITMREGDGPSNRMIQLSIDGVMLTKRELRTTPGGLAFNHLFQTQDRNWLRLTRSGNTFGAYHSTDGANWAPVIITNIMMTSCIEMGFITENSAPSGTVTGVFGNVEIMGGAAPLSAPETPDIAVSGEVLQPQIGIYPNPTAGKAYLDLSAFSGESVRINLYHSTGQFIKTIELDEVQVPTEELNLEGLPSGQYLVEIQTAQIKITEKLVLTK